MKSFVITIPGHQTSLSMAQRAIDSCPYDMVTFDGTTPETVVDEYRKRGFKYMDRDVKSLPEAGKPSKTKAACAMSHFRMWELCKELNEPIIVLEHDGYFSDTPSQDLIDRFINSDYGACSFSQPKYGLEDTFKVEGFQPVRQGILCLSYMMKPWAATKLIEHSYNVKGLRQNDSFYQFGDFPFLGATIDRYVTENRIVRSSWNWKEGKDEDLHRMG